MLALICVVPNSFQLDLFLIHISSGEKKKTGNILLATSRRSSLMSGSGGLHRPRFHSPQVRAPPKLYEDEDEEKGGFNLESIREENRDEDEDDPPVAPGTPLL